MEGLENKNAQFQRRREGVLYCSSSEMNTNSNSMPEKICLYKSSIATSGDAFLASGWDSFGNLGQSQNFESFLSHEELSSSYQRNMLENPHSFDSTYVEMVSKFPNFSEMGSSFALPQFLQIENDDSPPNHLQENGAAGSSPNDKRRKREPDRYEKIESDLGKDSNGDSSDDLRENDEKKPKIVDKSPKQTAKQAKDSSSNPETFKENYIHVRARRGEATNSHSLAERIRREKISDRMKLLQELVPGCNKITGKAVMLDEIINYVQSLQQQVEFLSMKLATVNPEIYTNIERILSKDMLHSHCSSFFPGRMLVPESTFSEFLPRPRVSLGSSIEAISFPASATLTEDKLSFHY